MPPPAPSSSILPRAATGPAVSEPPTPPAGSTKLTPPTPDLQPASIGLPHPYAFPWSAVGKVFFTDPTTNKNFQCSGTAVTSENRSTVDTAGHCVAAEGENRFYKNWSFCPQFLGKCSSGLLWTARRLVAHKTWLSTGGVDFDYGAAVMRPNSQGRLIDRIGGAGWAYNLDQEQITSQRYYAFGFPAGAPFDGKQLRFCSSDFQRFDKPGPGLTTIGIPCDMNGGSSGGGWLISLDGTFGYTNGHNDYKKISDPTDMFSPTYGDDWFEVFDKAQNL